jgi:hypothetical protein
LSHFNAKPVGDGSNRIYPRASSTALKIRDLLHVQAARFGELLLRQIPLCTKLSDPVADLHVIFLRMR